MNIVNYFIDENNVLHVYVEDEKLMTFNHVNNYEEAEQLIEYIKGKVLLQ